MVRCLCFNQPNILICWLFLPPTNSLYIHGPDTPVPNLTLAFLAFQTLSVWICHHTFGVMHESVTNSNKTEGQSCLLWEPLPSGKMSLFIFISSHHLPPPLSSKASLCIRFSSLFIKDQQQPYDQLCFLQPFPQI